jgi:hypothetical protein
LEPVCVSALGDWLTSACLAEVVMKNGVLCWLRRVQWAEGRSEGIDQPDCLQADAGHQAWLGAGLDLAHRALSNMESLNPQPQQSLRDSLSPFSVTITKCPREAYL